jgi:hypothetical protein
MIPENRVYKPKAQNGGRDFLPEMGDQKRTAWLRSGVQPGTQLAAVGMWVQFKDLDGNEFGLIQK